MLLRESLIKRFKEAITRELVLKDEVFDSQKIFADSAPSCFTAYPRHRKTQHTDERGKRARQEKSG